MSVTKKIKNARQKKYIKPVKTHYTHYTKIRKERRKTKVAMSGCFIIVFIISFLALGALFLDNHNEKNFSQTTKKIVGQNPEFVTIKGLSTVKLFVDMDMSDVASFKYYGQVVRNTKDYHELVGDKRIYDVDKCRMLFLHHSYRYDRYYILTDDIKRDFLGSFLRQYHGLAWTETDRLVDKAWEFAKKQ